jgi:Asp-tRNA(Asn)/Glu-tRNA(Gln) amidotransferase C subunit
VNLCNAFREDLSRPAIVEDDALRNAPASEWGCFKVPKIIEG